MEPPIPRRMRGGAVVNAAEYERTQRTESLGTTAKEGSTMDKVNVRYIVNDVDAAIKFYADMLGFKVEMHPAPGFASLSKGNLQLLLNKPGAGGAGQAMGDGRAPSPGGWNRFQIGVGDLAATVEKLKSAGCRFRNEIVVGNGGKQILAEDPSGNCVELFEPFRDGAARGGQTAQGDPRR